MKPLRIRIISNFGGCTLFNLEYRNTLEMHDFTTVNSLYRICFISYISHYFTMFFWARLSNFAPCPFYPKFWSSVSLLRLQYIWVTPKRHFLYAPFFDNPLWLFSCENRPKNPMLAHHIYDSKTPICHVSSSPIISKGQHLSHCPRCRKGAGWSTSRKSSRRSFDWGDWFLLGKGWKQELRTVNICFFLRFLPSILSKICVTCLWTFWWLHLFGHFFFKIAQYLIY